LGKSAGRKIRVLETDPGDEVAAFVGALYRSGTGFRSFEEQGRIVIETEGEAHAELIRRLYAAWMRGDRDWLTRLPKPEEHSAAQVFRELGRYPAVLILLIAAVVIFPLLGGIDRGEVNALASVLLIVDVERGLDVSLARLSGDHEYWRWFTPVLVHFSWMHVAFNSAAVFEFGRRIEAVTGAGVFLLLVVLIGVLGNLTQVAFQVSPLFGGLSGVAYGLLGYILVRSRLDPANRFWKIHPAVSASMLLFLVLFSTGVTGLFGFRIANAAHWGGLAAGCLFALIAGRPRAPGR
jgi:GlpG protein